MQVATRGSLPVFFNDTPTTEIYTLSLHDALPISAARGPDQGNHHAGEEPNAPQRLPGRWRKRQTRSEEHTSELQSLTNLVCRLLLEKKKQGEKTDALRRCQERCDNNPTEARRQND